MKDTHDPDLKVIKELVEELDEFNSYMRESKEEEKRSYKSGNYYAFDPNAKIDKVKYKKDMALIGAIYRLLDENHVNIKSLGYSHIKDAVCIIIDMKSMDICFTKELYPYIAEKYNMNNTKGIRRVEHSIRNALDAAYALTKTKYPDDDCLMNRFSDKPTNKAFLLRFTQEVGHSLFKEMNGD